MNAWPRMLKRTRAAEYCDLSEAAFEREIIAGRLPAGVMLGGREHWCKNALDKALDILAGAHEADAWEKEFWDRGKAA